MEYQCFPEEWSTGTVFDHPTITENLGAEEDERIWPAVVVVWTTSDHATLDDGKSRASAHFAKYPHATAVVMPQTYENSSEVHVEDVARPLMVA